MNRPVKKLLSLLLSAAMLTGLALPAMAAEAEAEAEADASPALLSSALLSFTLLSFTLRIIRLIYLVIRPIY